MVHSTGINTSDTIRMSCIQDFTRVKPRKNIMWSIEGGSHTVDGVVTFDETQVLGKCDGDRCANNKIHLPVAFRHKLGSVRAVVLLKQDLRRALAPRYN